MRNTWSLTAVVLAACGSRGGSMPEHAVGTYIGGGSFLAGPDKCTYSGTPGVFDKDSDKPEGGPRLVFGAGTVTQECGGTKTTIKTVVPTGATISGPKAVKKGGDDNHFYAHLAANGHELDGEASLDWKLGSDCNGVAEFGPVLGAQDTGGRDRTRTLVPTGKGKCTLIATLTTGSVLYEQFKPQTFQTEMLVSVE